MRLIPGDVVSLMFADLGYAPSLDAMRARLGLDRPLPQPITPEARPYWDGLKQEKLMLPKCGDCGHVFWYPRVLCPRCHSRHITWVQSSGKGKLYAFEIAHQSFNKAIKVPPPYVLAMVELACWDIIGKVTGQPVYRLLGGAVRDRVPAYGNGWYTVERRPEEFAAAAGRAVAKGYRALKVDPFGAGGYELTRDEHRLSISIVRAIREAVGDDERGAPHHQPVQGIDDQMLGA